MANTLKKIAGPAYLAAAATDIYTQCGFKKLICISHLADFTVSHLSNKYAGKMGLEEASLHRQLTLLLSRSEGAPTSFRLLPPATKLFHERWSKSYYEAPQTLLLERIPQAAHSILSVGCGWGATEATLVERGGHVTAVALDPIISISAQDRGVEIVHGDFPESVVSLAGRLFDCIILSNVLHLYHHPVGMLSSCVAMLRKGGVMLVSVPHLPRLLCLLRIARYGHKYQGLGCYQKSGTHSTSRHVLQRWFRTCGLKDTSVCFVAPENRRRFGKWSLGTARRILAAELVVRGRK